jgi:pyroglutamyl-peptidase
VTGFGPFPGVPFNASERLVYELAAMRLRLKPGSILLTEVLPTDWLRATAKLGQFLDDARPDLLVHFGVSSRARSFVLETRAFNQTSRRADCSGAYAAQRWLRRSGPAMLQASLPCARVVQRLRIAGITATLSADPGRYLCNAVLFESLMLADAAERAPLVGFVHIPPLPPPGATGSATGGSGGFGWEMLRRGSALILESLAHPALRHHHL